MTSDSRWAAITRNEWIAIGGGVALLIAITVFAILSAQGDDPVPTTLAAPIEQETSTSTTIPDVDLEVVIDASISPVVATIPGFHPNDAPRPVGRIVNDDGVASDFVIGEAIVTVPDLAALETLRNHPDVEVVDYDYDPDADPEDGVDVLVRARDVSSLNLDEAAWRFASMEPVDGTTLRVDSAESAATGIILGRLWNDVGPDVSMNIIPTGHDVDEGQLLEGLDSDLNAFNWPYINSLATQQIGLDTAWQMLDVYANPQTRVKVLVIDRGFIQNPDLSEGARLRKADWGPDDTSVCSGGNPCPYHGTQVTLTVAGIHDNLWGTAGVAYPWVQIVQMRYGPDTYGTMKNAREVIKDEKPDVVNMSFGLRSVTNPDATRRQYDKTFRRADRWAGTIAFASAGNEGENVDVGAKYLPCASHWVVCVGGMKVDDTEKHDGSNYGSSTGDTSVQIYGPFCVYAYADPAANDGRAGQICGTSFASPFVAGVAALLRVADPEISRRDIKTTLFDTAHVGGLGPLATGEKRRIDAHMAVAAALGVVWAPPTVTIDTAPGDIPAGEIIELSGHAESFVGEPVGIQWFSSIDGALNPFPDKGTIGANLSPGNHVIQAVATDRRGLASTAAIAITVENEPPIVQILSPTDGQELYEGSALHMVAYTHDPDIYVNAALPEDKVVWEIKQGSTVVWSSDGHNLVTALDHGNYTIVLTGTDLYGVSRSDSVDIVMKELLPGQQPPQLSIITPNSDVSEGIGNGTKGYDLKGFGKDLNGNVISGTRFNWTATADTGYSFDICVGSAVPGQGGGGGGFIILKDCKETHVDLGMAPGAVGRTIWTITLTVDINGTPVEAVRAIELIFATG